MKGRNGAWDSTKSQRERSQIITRSIVYNIINVIEMHAGLSKASLVHSSSN